MRISRILVTGCLVCWALCSPASAHTVNLFCFWEEGHVRGEGYFGKGRPVQHGEVLVYDPSGQVVLARTVTDEQGRFILDLQRISAVKILLKAGPGHQAEFFLAAEEDEPGDGKGYPSEMSDGERLPGGNIRALEAQVKALEHQQAARFLVTVVGGLGWIAGLFALLYFLKVKHAS